MRKVFVFTTWATIALPLVAGCVRSPSPPADAEPPVVWVEEGIRHEGLTIALGYRGELESAERWIEPVAAISRDGQSIASAMVFSSLLSADSSQVIADEVATLYEPAAGQAPALYAAGQQPLPSGVTECIARFRVSLPEVADDWSHELLIKGVRTH